MSEERPKHYRGFGGFAARETEAQRIHERREWLGVRRGRAAAFDHAHPSAESVPEFLHEARLADSRIAREQHEIAASALDVGREREQTVQLPLTRYECRTGGV